MSATVDILSVMDQAIQREKDAGRATIAQTVARAAIAELLAADKEYDSAEQECVDHHRPLFKRGKEWSERQAAIDARCDAAIARRSAALAIFGDLS